MAGLFAPKARIHGDANAAQAALDASCLDRAFVRKEHFSLKIGNHDARTTGFIGVDGQGDVSLLQGNVVDPEFPTHQLGFIYIDDEMFEIGDNVPTSFV